MTVLELKGDMMEKISVLKDKSVVEELHRLVNAYISQGLEQPDFWDEMTPAQREHLMKAIEAAKDKSKWIPREEALKMYYQIDGDTLALIALIDLRRDPAKNPF